MNLKEIKFSKKIVFCLVAISIIVSSLLTASWVQSVYVGDLTTFTASSPFSNYSYIVGKYNSTFYYAQNQSSGAYDYLLSNATTTIQNAINQVDSKSVYIMDGTYTIYPMLTIAKNNFELCGTWNTILKASASLPGGYSGSVIRANQVYGVYIHDLQIDGSRLTRVAGDGHDAGINLASCNYSKIEKCYVHDCPSIGIGGSNALYSKRSYFNEYVNNLVIQNEWNGITEGGDDYPSVGLKLLGNTVINFCDVGISCYGYNSIIANNHIVLNASLDTGEGAVNSYWAIGTEGNYDYNNTIANNFMDYSLAPITVGSMMTIHGYGQLIENNEFVGGMNVEGAVTIDNSDYNIIRGGSIRSFMKDWAGGISILSGSNYTVISSVSFMDCMEKAIYFQSTNSKTVIMSCTIINTPNLTTGDALVKIHDNFDFSTNSWIADV